MLAKNDADMESLSDAYNALEAANIRLESEARHNSSAGEPLRIVNECINCGAVCIHWKSCRSCRVLNFHVV